MFDLSLAEIAIVVVLAVVVIGPKDIPVVLRTLGRWWRGLREVAGEFRKTIDEASGVGDLRDLQRERSFIRDDQGRLQEVYDISEFMENDDRSRDDPTSSRQ